MASATSTQSARPYPFQEIEPKWQQIWEDRGLFHSEPSKTLPNCVVIELPPFANGNLHLGHVRNYAIGDVFARFRRMTGFNVLYTSGFDSFGLPNELAAREVGRHPKDVADEVILEMRRDFVRLGLSHDTRRIIGNHDESFYGWVQWVFLKLFEQNLAYRQRYPVLWCPHCECTLADSLALGGNCWRCRTPVETKSLEQWLVKEAVFADDMLESLPRMTRWPARIKRIHTDWIGPSEGVLVRMPVTEYPDVTISAFVAQPESLPNLLKIGLAREHPALTALALKGAIDSACLAALEHLSHSTREYEQVALPVHAFHPLTGEGVPVWVDGNLDLRTHEGVAVFVSSAAGTAEERVAIVDELHRRGTGEAAVRYRLRDWNIARQRYWGPPIPIVHCPECGAVAVPEKDLPVLLPLDVDLEAPGNPLERHADFLSVNCPKCGAAAKRDTDTLETYCSPWWYHWNAKHTANPNPFDREEARLYMPVDVMIGGEDQARTCFFHLRMMARALRQAGVVELDEPIDTLIAIGMVKSGGRKMSKSEGNTVNPMELIDRYGTDSLRFAILAAAAPDSDFNWSEDSIRKAYSFLNRVWTWTQRIASEVRLSEVPPLASIDESYSLSRKLARQVETAISRTTESMCRNMYHLVCSNVQMLLERVEEYEDEARKRRKALDARDCAALGISAAAFLRMIAPLCPHLAEECWQALGGEGLASQAPWPAPFPENFRKARH